MNATLARAATLVFGTFLNVLIHSMVISAVIITAPVLLLILAFSKEAFLHTLRFDRVRHRPTSSAHPVH